MKPEPKAGNRYRQIVVVEKESFEVRIFEGAVLRVEPKFAADNPDAEVYLHPTLKDALADADKEAQESKEAGWIPHVGP
jgi:hypothetical protein